MPFPEFDPVLIHLGPLPIRWYALAYVAGIVLGWWYASRLAKTERLWAPGKPPVSGPFSHHSRWLPKMVKSMANVGIQSTGSWFW